MAFDFDDCPEVEFHLLVVHELYLEAMIMKITKSKCREAKELCT